MDKYYCLDGQSCFDAVNVRRQGLNVISRSSQVIIPRSNFSCNGRITGYQLSLRRGMFEELARPPVIQVWRPTSSTTYTRVDTECLLAANDIMLTGGGTNVYNLGTVSCTGNNRIEFQAGDVIGYHHANFLLYHLYTITTMGYIAYVFDTSNPLSTLNINSADSVMDFRQPLIEIMFGKMSNLTLAI